MARNWWMTTLCKRPSKARTTSAQHNPTKRKSLCLPHQRSGIGTVVLVVDFVLVAVVVVAVVVLATVVVMAVLAVHKTDCMNSKIVADPAVEIVVVVGYTVVVVVVDIVGCTVVLVVDTVAVPVSECGQSSCEPQRMFEIVCQNSASSIAIAER